MRVPQRMGSITITESSKTRRGRPQQGTPGSRGTYGAIVCDTAPDVTLRLAWCTHDVVLWRIRHLGLPPRGLLVFDDNVEGPRAPAVKP